MRLPVLFGYIVLMLMTIAYCVLAWYGSHIWALFLDQNALENLPLISLLCIAPLPFSFWLGMIHWQLLAVISLTICMSWGFSRSRLSGNDEGHAMPMAVHTAWIVFAICCHHLGAIIPMVTIGTILIN